MYYVIIFLLLRKLGHLVTIKYDSRPSKGLYKNYMTPRKGGVSANEGIQLFFLWEIGGGWSAKVQNSDIVFVQPLTVKRPIDKFKNTVAYHHNELYHHPV